ncbi:uncharacterized protein Bfra_005778 [Botrytis fragariae]|uniref:Uncharacterized protein n=1 Tax=Botrytis fragariae TaxID=1964551 RepID=A0A8H6ARZ3_9HELO|nr:uncharacterized protein Bfra_005778 [Botrytis fragariae]KAF5872419.1 hypothetical protein Bfra_005778 [Botrytis fragariae]
MPPYEFNPRITSGRPNHPCNYLPAKKIIFKYNGQPPDRDLSKYGRGSEAKDKYALARYDYMERLLFNDSEKGQAERQAQEDERVRKEKEAKQKRKDDEKSRKEQGKRLKNYGEPSGGHKEERHGLLGSSRRH